MSQHQDIVIGYLTYILNKWECECVDDDRPWYALNKILSEKELNKAIFMSNSNDQILYVCAFRLIDNLLFIRNVCAIIHEHGKSVLHMIALLLKKYNLNIAIQNTKENIQIINKLLPADITGETQLADDLYILHTANMNVDPYILEGYYNMYIDGRRD